MRVLLPYFSATGNTGQIAGVIQQRLRELGGEVDLLDITRKAAREEVLELAPYGGVVFGSPIHSMRAPRVVREWLASLNGQGKKCAMFFTYGGFQVHPTHYTTRQILEGRGFKVVASAEFLGKHTFNLGGWDAMKGRPDDSDSSVAVEYADLIYKRFSGEDPGMVGDLDKGPYTDQQLDQFELFRFKALTQLPTRNGEECQMCLLCEDLCPTGAINAEAGEAQQDLCICCLRCVANCPDEALSINDLTPVFALKMKNDGETDESLRVKKSKIYR